MPVSKYFGGHGDEVMSNMTQRYGAKKGKSVFYATANKRNAIPSHGIPEDTPELGPRTRGRGDGISEQAGEQHAHIYEERAKPRPGNPPFGPMTPGGAGSKQAHVYEERAKPRPGQPPFGPMTPGGKGIESSLRGDGTTNPYGWARGLMPNNAKICKGM